MALSLYIYFLAQSITSKIRNSNFSLVKETLNIRLYVGTKILASFIPPSYTFKFRIFNIIRIKSGVKKKEERKNIVNGFFLYNYMNTVKRALN